MDSLTLKLNGKHQMPLYAIFKGNCGESSICSDKSKTHLGRYQKKNNQTIYRYDNSDDIYND